MLESRTRCKELERALRALIESTAETEEACWKAYTEADTLWQYDLALREDAERSAQ